MWFVEWALEATPRVDHDTHIDRILRASRAALGRSPSVAEAERALAWACAGHRGRVGAFVALHALLET